MGTPSLGSLVPISRSRHYQGDMAVTITITVESRFSTLAAFFEAKESPEQPLKLPNPSHPCWGMGALEQWRPAEVENFAPPAATAECSPVHVHVYTMSPCPY